MTTRRTIHDTFTGPELAAPWRPTTYGRGSVELKPDALTCAIAPASDREYSDAQITDYAGLARRDYPWSPPLRLTVRAWASHSVNHLRGTAGFGFWNEPFVPTSRSLPRPPRAAWFFFGSPPNNMALAMNVPGRGWKAATLDATRLPFWALAPLAPVGFLLMRIPALYRKLWPIGQWALGVAEAPLPVDLDTPHTYTLEWRRDGVCWAVDDEIVLQSGHSPAGPLGFIAWIDNQYAVVTPQGRFRFGCVTTEDQQWLALDRVSIEAL